MRDRLLCMSRVLLAALFMSYYAGATLFTHTHSFEGGSVTHSHPYVPSGNHTHSAASIHLINTLTLAGALLGVAVTLATVAVADVTYVVRALRRVIHTKLLHCPLRAPPVC